MEIYNKAPKNPVGACYLTTILYSLKENKGNLKCNESHLALKVTFPESVSLNHITFFFFLNLAIPELEMPMMALSPLNFGKGHLSLFIWLGNMLPLNFLEQLEQPQYFFFVKPACPH